MSAPENGLLGERGATMERRCCGFACLGDENANLAAIFGQRTPYHAEAVRPLFDYRGYVLGHLAHGAAAGQADAGWVDASADTSPPMHRIDRPRPASLCAAEPS